MTVLQERLSLYQDKLEKFIDLSKGTFFLFEFCHALLTFHLKILC
jgi:hypothetical protein